MSRFFITLLVFAVACTDKHPGLYIDDGCNDVQIAAAFEAAAAWNDFVGYEIVEIEVKDFGVSMWDHLFNDDEYDIIACLDPGTKRLPARGAGGYRYGDIAIRDQPTELETRHLMYHEIGHWLGGDDIIDRCDDAIMFWLENGALEFTDCDREVMSFLFDD